MQTSFRTAQVTGNAYVVGDTREFGLNIPATLGFYVKNGRLTQAIYEVSNRPAVSYGIQPLADIARRTPL